MAQERDIPIQQAAKIAAAIVNGKDEREALTLAGFSPTARIRPVMESPRVRAALRIALETVGVTDEKIANTIYDCLEATTTLVGRHEGEIVGEKVVPDFKVRLQAAVAAADIREGAKKNWQPPEGWQPRLVIVNAKYANVFLSEEELAARGDQEIPADDAILLAPPPEIESQGGKS